MDSTNQNIKIISYNIQSFGKDKYNTVHDLLKRCDFLLLQEVWKYEYEFINIVKRDFEGYECLYTSAMNEKVPLTGRPYGGVGIMCKTNIHCNAEKIECISKIICAINITFESSSLLFFNTSRQ